MGATRATSPLRGTPSPDNTRRMSGITLATAQARLDLYLAAEASVLAGQRYEIDGRSLTRANLAEVQSGINIWNQRVQRLSRRSAGGSVAIVPRPRF